MEITIRKADAADLDAVVRVYEHVHDAEEAGPAQVGWVRGVYPVRSTAEAALERGDLFVEEADGAVVGTGIFNRLQADVYAGAPWQYDAPDDQIMVLQHAGRRSAGRKTGPWPRLRRILRAVRPGAWLPVSAHRHQREN